MTREGLGQTPMNWDELPQKDKNTESEKDEMTKKEKMKGGMTKDKIKILWLSLLFKFGIIFETNICTNCMK